MKKIILLTNSFPYDKGETYLETEVNYYERFDAVDMFSLAVRRNKEKRAINSEKIKVHPIFFASKLIYVLNMPRVLVDINFYLELIKLIIEKRLSISRIKRLMIFIMRARYEASLILKYSRKNLTNNLNDTGVIYSYRLEYQTYVALLLKKHLPNYKVLARGHRYDLYEYANSDNYIPLREKILENLDTVISISEDGKRYLENKYPSIAKKILVSRLGTLDYGVKDAAKSGKILHIVSCSNVVMVKRLDKIIESLSLISDFEVHWTHYGDGIMLSKIKQFANEKLSSNITVDFKGFVSNQDVLKEYASVEYNIFVNVSESEGIPVSIMEALSFGIPVIATNVGGTNEIIVNGYNGILIDKDFGIKELSDLIVKFSIMDCKEYQQFRHNAREYWEINYDANKNYTEFSKYLYKLTD